MDQNTSAVLFSLAVYALYVLLPLIPSIIIYKIFPDTRVTAEGSVSNWKIRAGGAFAAYVTVVLLGHVAIAPAQEIINGMSTCTWTVHGRVLLKDKDGQAVRGNTLIETMEVTMRPDIISKQNQVVNVHGIPSQGIAPQNSTLKFSIPHFGDQTIDIHSSDGKILVETDEGQIKGVNVDLTHRSIDIGQEGLVIQEFKPAPAETPSVNPTPKYQAPMNPPPGQAH